MKTVIICGGSKGLGSASLKNALDRGFKVICVSRSKGNLSSEILQNPNFKLNLCDLSNEDQRSRLVKSLSLEPNIWGLVNNTSGPATSSAESSTDEDYLRAFETHFFAANALVQAVLPQLKKNNGGRIINILSVTARIPIENMSVSNTVRGAMLNWSKTLSKELAKFNITVNNILPGYTETERLVELVESASVKEGISKEEYANKLIAQIPLRRFGRPEEIGSGTGFLLSAEASFINGASIPVDGGWTPSS